MYSHEGQHLCLDLCQLQLNRPDALSPSHVMLSCIYHLTVPKALMSLFDGNIYTGLGGWGVCAARQPRLKSHILACTDVSHRTTM